MLDMADRGERRLDRLLDMAFEKKDFASFYFSV